MKRKAEDQDMNYEMILEVPALKSKKQKDVEIKHLLQEKLKSVKSLKSIKPLKSSTSITSVTPDTHSFKEQTDSHLV